VIDLDIRSFFSSVDHELILKAVQRHTGLRWVLLYVERWLKAPLQREDGTLEQRDRGTPEGSAISPLLANLFSVGAVLHRRWRGRSLWPVVLRGRPAGGGRKPPQAAAVKSRGGERCGEGAP
jgi:retron-type reverse transcriptase